MVSHTTLSTTILALWALTVAVHSGIAAAQPASDTRIAATATVDVCDLTLAQEGGMRSASLRIRAATPRVCNDVASTHSVDRFEVYAACERASLTAALARLHDAQLAATAAPDAAQPRPGR